VEVRALEGEHGLKALLPYGVLLILNREKRILAQGGEGDVCHHFNTGVRLTTDDGP
jgi:hypothetical protein